MSKTITQKVIPIAILALIVLAFSLVAGNVLKPNEQTPLKAILPSPEPKVFLPEGQVIGAWVWQYPSQLKNSFPGMISLAQAEKVNTFYVNIDEYVDIYEMAEGKLKAEKLEEYLLTIKNIITEAKAKNIKVHALSGNPAYSYDSHEYIPPILLNHVFEFNRENPEIKFEGIQFDIEFYEDSRFWGDAGGYTQNYLKLINTLTDLTISQNKKLGQNVRLGISVPFWFDKPNDYFEKPIFSDIVTTLSKLPDAYLVIMAYRNTIEGEGSVMSVAVDELKITEKTPVKIILGQEIMKNKDTKITHFGKSKDQIKTDLILLINTAKIYSSFEGIAIHDLDTLIKTR